MKNLVRDYYDYDDENYVSMNNKQKFNKHKPNWK